MVAFWQESYDKTRQYVKKQRYHFGDKGPYNQIYGISSSHVQMWEMDSERALKNWCFWTVVLENTIESPLENKGIKLVNLKGNQPSIFSERTAVEAEAPIFWPPDVNSLEKTLMLWKIEDRRIRGTRGWDGWMASLTQWTWTWANSRRWWGTEKPGVL